MGSSRPKRSSLSKAQRKLLLWICLGFVLAAVTILVVLPKFSQTHRERIDGWYHDIYAAFDINPVFRDIADIKRNIPYCGTSSRFQQLDIYLPKGEAGIVPAVVYVHGGGWALGDKASSKLVQYGTAIIEQNMALVSVNYRLAPDYTYPAQNEDVACAVSFLHSEGVRYGIDPNNIGLWGDSAGGQLAAMTALDPAFKPHIGAVVEFYGTSDIWAQITRDKKRGRGAIAYIGSSVDKAKAQQASPLYADPAGAPPFLLFHGLNDKTVPYGQSVSLAGNLIAAGVDARLRTVERADHNFTNNSKPSAKQIEREMAAFFKERLRR